MAETDRWPLRLLAREAARNTLILRGRLTPLVLAAVLAGSAHVAVAVNASHELDAALTALEVEGRHLVDLTAAPRAGGDAPAEETGLRRGACENLATLPGVVAAGVITEDEARASTPQTGPFLPLRRVSPSLLPAVAEHDIVIGTSAAGNLGLDPGDRLVLGGLGAEPLDAVVGGSRALPSTLALFAAPMPTITLAETCRVELARFADPARMTPVLLGSVEGVGGRFVAEPLLVETTDRVALHLDRIDRRLPLLLGALGGLVTAVLARLRASELATYRLAGTSRRSLGLILGLESALLGGVFATSSVLAAIVVRDELLSPLASALAGAAGACAWVLVAGVLSVPVLRRRPSDMAKDR